MRWMNRLATALTALTVIAGPPLLAAAWLQRHPWRTPTQADIQTWAEQPLTVGTIIAGCVGVAGLGWLLLVAYLAHRTVAEVRRQLWRARHLPMPTPAQLTASSMAGVAAFTLPAIPTSHHHPPPAAADTPRPSDSAGTDTSHQALAPSAGVALPGGGWIPYRTAAAITALAALTWLHRRRHYRPDPRHPRDHRTDPDLQPFPGTINTITTALAAADTTEPAATTPLAPDGLPHGILRLTGPGATAAGRGLLVTAALTTASTGATPQIRVRLEDLPTLLPGTGIADLPAAALAPTTGPGHSNQPVAGHDHDNIADRLSRPADPLALSDPHDDAHTVIVLGDHPRATNVWHIDADGITTGTGLTEPRRLCTLDLRAATDLLTLTRTSQAPAPATDTLRPTSEAGPSMDPAYATAAHLTLLGGCELTISGTPVRLRRTGALQILAYLAIHPGGATRAELTRAVWPHLPAATIPGRFHTTLTDLRTQLHPLLGEEPVTRHEDRYRLNTHAIGTDLRPWTAAVTALTHAVGTTAQQNACRSILDLYRGHLADGRTWPWLTPAREQIRRTVIDACSTLAEHADPDEALTWLRHAITIDPYNEPLHQQAADLLHAAGDHTGAADLIKRLHRRLADGAHTHRHERPPADSRAVHRRH
jgi:DNA-binding SARP family transcriptional activator